MSDVVGRSRPTRRAVDAYLAEAESWKILHDEAVDCLEFESLVLMANSAMDNVSRWDAMWHGAVFRGKIPHDDSNMRDIASLYHAWLGCADSILGSIAHFEGLGYEVSGAAEFRKNVTDARGALMSDDEFFGDRYREREAQAITEHRAGLTVEFEEMGD